jgi:hypothetical protein
MAKVEDAIDPPRNSDEQCRAIVQLKDTLDLALPEGLIANNGSTVVIMEGPCQNLTGTCAASVDEYSQGGVAIQSPAILQHHPLQIYRGLLIATVTDRENNDDKRPGSRSKKSIALVLIVQLYFTIYI